MNNCYEKFEHGVMAGIRSIGHVRVMKGIEELSRGEIG